MSIHPVMQRLADKLKRTDLPAFVPGDQVRVQVKIKEGDKERLQAFEGPVSYTHLEVLSPTVGRHNVHSSRYAALGRQA